MASVTLGERVCLLRQSRRWTLAVLAQEAGLSVSYLNDIEHDRTVPTLGRLVAIASALQLTVSELLESTRPYGHVSD